MGRLRPPPEAVQRVLDRVLDIINDSETDALQGAPAELNFERLRKETVQAFRELYEDAQHFEVRG